MSIGHHPTQDQHTPDMRKKDEDITQEDMAEARRRIEGSIDDSSGDRGIAKMAATMAG
jgi:phosphatidylserine decarboxylase